MTIDTQELVDKITTAPGRYDLPLPRSMGSGFLILLVALMTCISVFASAGSLVLSTISDRWASGLQSALTVEIPAQQDGQTQQLTELVAGKLRSLANVKSANALQNNDMKDLLAPWMGKDNRILETAPLPGIISVELKDTSDATIKSIEAVVKSNVASASIDRHQDWLSHVLRLAGSLNFASILLVLVITLTTVTAVAGAVRAQMAAFHDHIEILHLMGATDRYISQQFARHATFLGLRGALIGFAVALICLLFLKLYAGATDMALLPDFSLGISGWVVLFVLPFTACAIVMITAYFTVHRTLQSLP